VRAKTAALALKERADLAEQNRGWTRRLTARSRPRCACHSASRNRSSWLDFNLAHRFPYGLFFTWLNTCRRRKQPRHSLLQLEFSSRSVSQGERIHKERGKLLLECANELPALQGG
jgi:hypothetical protein